MRELIKLSSLMLVVGLATIAGMNYRSGPTSRQKNVQQQPVLWTQWRGYSNPGAGSSEHLLELMRPIRTTTGASSGLHYLYFWGKECQLEIDGRSLLLVDAVRNGLFDKSNRSPFFRSSDGLVRVANEMYDGEAHLGQLLSYFGDMGEPSSYCLTSEQSPITIEEAVTSTCATFALEGEFEWQLLSLLHYLPPTKAWRNRWGEEFSFDRCAHAICDRDLGTGPCQGTHALAVAAAILNVNDRFPIVTAPAAQKLETFLRQAAQLLMEHQCAGGGWNGSWYETQKPLTLGACSVQTTGHHLEWILDAPVAVRPRHEVIDQAVKACRNRMASAKPVDCQDHLCAFTHAIKSVFYYEQLQHASAFHAR